MLPKEAREQYERASPEEQQQFQALRLRGQTDQMFLATDVLAGTALGDFQPIPHNALFGEFLKKDPTQEANLFDLDTEVKKRLILWPRGLFKTSAVAVEIVQLILNFPNIRILILSGSKDLAMRQLAVVKKVFERPTKKFRKLYPEFCAPENEKLGTTKEFTVPCRTMDFREPTVSISSNKSVKAGSHYDVIFCDDLVNDQNYMNAKALAKTFEEYKQVGPLLEPAGFIFVTGTRYSFGDTYERIWEKALEEMKKKGRSVWRISARSCWARICKTCNHADHEHNFDLNYKQPPCTKGCGCTCFVDSGKKELLFPVARTKDGRTIGHTLEYLESERHEKGDEFFACQYENNPVSADSQTYTQELLDRQTFHHLIQIPPANDGLTFIMGDLSYTGDERGGEKRDASVLFINRYAQGRIFTFDCLSGRWDSQQVAENLIFAMMRYRPHISWLEKFPAWESYDRVIKSYAIQQGLQLLPLEWLPMDNQKEAKKVRMGSIKPWLVQDKLRIFAGMPGYDILCAQLKKWPKLGRHDDYGDCLGLVVNAPHGAALDRIPQTKLSPEQEQEYYRAQALAAFQRKMRPPEALPQMYSNGCGAGIVC